MTEKLAEIAVRSPAYRWHIRLRPPGADDPRLGPDRMTAAEQMFFLGAPLAHVVEFERRLRIQRLNGPRKGAGRLTRIAIRRACDGAVSEGEIVLAEA